MKKIILAVLGCLSISMFIEDSICAHEEIINNKVIRTTEESFEKPGFTAVEEYMLWFGYGCPDKANYNPSNFSKSEKEKYIEDGLNWLKNHKNKDSFEQLAYYYREKNDSPKALYWAFLGAEKGSGFCMSFLRWSYSHGEGVVQDYEEAIKWTYLAAAKGIDEDKKLLNELKKSNMGVVNSLIEDGRIHANEWMKKHPDAFFDPN